MAMPGPSLQPWQWGVIVLSYLLFFVLPSVWMWRKARRDGEAAFVWTALVLVGSFMGVYEYYHHRGIQKARARRAARKAVAEADAQASPAGQENAQGVPGPLPPGEADGVPGR